MNDLALRDLEGLPSGSVTVVNQNPLAVLASRDPSAAYHLISRRLDIEERNSARSFELERSKIRAKEVAVRFRAMSSVAGTLGSVIRTKIASDPLRDHYDGALEVIEDEGFIFSRRTRIRTSISIHAWDD